MNLPHWPKMQGSRDIKLGLDRVLALLERLGNPHKKLPPTIHVAGTNGKGSTLAYLEAIFKDASYKVHKYTSPHLVKFNERIILANFPIKDAYLTRIINECEKAANIKPKIDVTFFEGITVAAFLAFSRIKADILLLETGMGGRLDATNVITNPILTIITSISFDHTEFLGKELKKIAFEKAGIIKEHSPVITKNHNPEILEVIEKRANELNSSLFYLGKHFEAKQNKDQMDFSIANDSFNFPLPNLIGDHQIENASLAIGAAYIQNKLKVNNQNIKNGLRNVKWKGRIEKINEGKLFKLLPKNYELYIDGGHNVEASRILCSWIFKENIKLIEKGDQKPKTYLICAMLKDKDSAGFFKYLSGAIDFVISVPIEHQSTTQKPSIIARHALNNGIKAAYSDDFEQAFKYIQAIHEGNDKKNILNQFLPKKSNKNPARIIICGSLYLVGEFLKEN